MENLEIGDPVVWFLWCGIAAFEPFITQSMLLISSRNLISLRMGHLYPKLLLCYLGTLFPFLFCFWRVLWVLCYLGVPGLLAYTFMRTHL